MTARSISMLGVGLALGLFASGPASAQDKRDGERDAKATEAPTPTKRYCTGYPVQPCRFRLRMGKVTHVDAPSDDTEGEFSFAFDLGGNGWSDEWYFQAFLDEGESAWQGQIIEDDIVVGCGETLDVPLGVHVFEQDYTVFGGTPTDEGWTLEHLELACLPDAPLAVHPMEAVLYDDWGSYRHRIDFDLRVEQSNPSACAAAPYDPHISASSCRVAVDLRQLESRPGMPGDDPGQYVAWAQVAGVEVEAWQFSDYLELHEGEYRWLDRPITTISVPCGVRMQVPFRMTGLELDDWSDDDSGSVSGTFEVSCPQTTRSRIVDVPLYSYGTSILKHTLRFEIGFVDMDWSRYSVDASNECCVFKQCPEECPVIGTPVDDACLVAYAAPGTAPFVWSPNAWLQGLYTTPLASPPYCPVGSWDTAHCHVASVPTSEATAYAEDNALWVGQCDPFCTEACPLGGTFDGANCYIGDPPGVSIATITNGVFTYAPLDLPTMWGCVPGSGPMPCQFGPVPVGTEPFVYENHYYVKSCRP